MGTKTLIKNALTVSQQANKLVSEKKITEAFGMIENFITETKNKIQEYQNISIKLDKHIQDKSLQIQKESDEQNNLQYELKSYEENNSLNYQRNNLKEKIKKYENEINNLKVKLDEEKSVNNPLLLIPFYNIKVIANVENLRKQINSKISYINDELIPQIKKLEDYMHITNNNINKIKDTIPKKVLEIGKIKDTIRALKAEQSFLNEKQAICTALINYFKNLQEGLKKALSKEIDVESISKWIKESSFDNDIKEIAQENETKQKEIENLRKNLSEEDKNVLNKILG